MQPAWKNSKNVKINTLKQFPRECLTQEHFFLGGEFIWLLPVHVQQKN